MHAVDQYYHVYSTRRQTHATAIVIPSVCLSVTLVIHAKPVQDIEIRFAPYDTLLYEDSSYDISWSYV